MLTYMPHSGYAVHGANHRSRPGTSPLLHYGSAVLGWARPCSTSSRGPAVQPLPSTGSPKCGSVVRCHMACSEYLCTHWSSRTASGWCSCYTADAQSSPRYAATGLAYSRLTTPAGPIGQGKQQILMCEVSSLVGAQGHGSYTASEHLLHAISLSPARSAVKQHRFCELAPGQKSAFCPCRLGSPSRLFPLLPLLCLDSISIRDRDSVCRFIRNS